MNRSSSNSLQIVLLMVLARAPVSAGAFVQDYHVTDLGTLGGTDAWAYGLNSTGVVVGSALNADGNSHAFVWSESTGMMDLGTLGGVVSRANAINDAGQVVGMAETAEGERHAFVWDSSGGMRDLGTLGGSFSVALANNNSGQLVGFASDGAVERAFIWDAQSGMRAIPDLGEHSSRANAINDLGTVVGSFETDVLGVWCDERISDGFIFDGQAVTILTSADRSLPHSITPTDINNQGVIVGSEELCNIPGDFYPNAFTYRDGRLARLKFSFFQATVSTASKINDVDQIIGGLTSGEPYGPSGESHVYLYDGTDIDLSSRLVGMPPGLALASVNDINGSGKMVGRAYTDRQNHAVLLSPLEPGTQPNVCPLTAAAALVILATGLLRKSSGDAP